MADASPSVPTVVEKHVLALTIALQPSGLVSGPIPNLTVEWLHAFNQQWPTLLSHLKKETTDPTPVWIQSWFQNREAPSLSISMWTKQVREQTKKYGKRIYEDSKMWVAMSMNMSQSIVETDTGSGASTKGALPHRVWEKFGIILPESIATLLEEIMDTLGQELVSSLKGSDNGQQQDVQDVFANIQRRFMQAIEQGKITEKDIKDTLAAFRNSLSGMADHAPPELRGMMKNMKKNMDRMMKKKPSGQTDQAGSSDATKESDEKETPAAPSAEVEEMMSMFTEFFQFVSDLQTRPELMQQGAHPFMKKMMKKAVKMMNKKGPTKPKLSSKEKLQRLLEEQGQ